jgi:hypothetical protein
VGGEVEERFHPRREVVFTSVAGSLVDSEV